MKQIRVVTDFIFSLDDLCPLTIRCPSAVSMAELADIQEFVRLWLRQLERSSKALTDSARTEQDASGGEKFGGGT